MIITIVQSFCEHLKNIKLRKKTPASFEMLIAVFLDLYNDLFQISLHIHKMNSLPSNSHVFPGPLYDSLVTDVFKSIF
jgi:hypothetical protein